MAYIGQNAEGNFTTTNAKDRFSGDGSTTTFTLSQRGTENNVDVFVNNVRQEPGVAYNIEGNGTSLVFTAAPSTGTNNIYVVNRGPAELSASHPAAQSLEAVDGTFTGNLTVDADATVTGDLTVDNYIRQNTNTNTVKFNGSSTYDFATILRNPSASANVHTRAAFFSTGNTSDSGSVWWGKYDGTDHIAHGAIDGIDSGGLSMWANNGSSWTKGVDMDNAGLVRMPRNVAFMVKASPSHTYNTTGWNKIIYDEQLTQTGSSYSTSTSKFTAPRDGWYHFTASYSRGKTSDSDGTIAFSINGSGSSDDYWGAASLIDGNDGTFDAGAISATLYLSANDTVEVQIYSTIAHTSRTSANWAGTFTGRYVG